MWSSPSDESLLAGFAAGDERSSAAFVRRFQDRVYGLALTIVRDPPLAEEVAQETFVRAWRYAGSFDRRRGPIAGWLLTIARNQAIDALRLRGARPLDADALEAALAREGPTGSSGSGSGSGSDLAATALGERQRVQRALATLPDEQRRPVVLAVYLGRTAREISELDGVPLGTVKTRIRTAFTRLRTELEVCDEL